MELFIIRHGETDYNKNRIIQGRGVNASLNETGRKQAQLFYESVRHIEFSKIFASSLLRTQESLKPFVDDGHEIESTSFIDEIDWGIHEGKFPSIELRDEYRKVLTHWQNGDLDRKIEMGESPLQVQVRMEKFIETHLDGHQGKMLICSHGRAIRIFLCTLLNKPLQHMDSFPHQNLSLYKLRKNENGFEVELFNSVEHLNGTRS